MWIIAVPALMNVIGLLSVAAGLILIIRDEGRDEGSWRNWLSSRHGQGTLSIIAGGCALLVSGQYKLVRLLYNAIRQPAAESVLGSGIVAVFVIGAVLLAIGAGLLYFEGQSKPVKASAAVTVARGYAIITAVGAIIVFLAGMNLFQYFTTPSSAVAPAG